jgi:hypothetical protein
MSRARELHASPVVRQLVRPSSFARVREPAAPTASIASTVVGSTVVLPGGLIAFVPASSSASRSREVFDALREENRFLANQLLETRRTLEDAHAQLTSERAQHAAELRAARGGGVGLGGRATAGPLSPSDFALVMSQSQLGAAAAVGGERTSVHHYHGPVHFHLHTAPQPSHGSSAFPGGGAIQGGAQTLGGGAFPGGGQAASAATSGAGGTLRIGPIACAALKNRDTKGRSDPFVRVVAASDQSARAESARKDDTLDPHWPSQLSLALPADEGCVIIEVWDYDHKGPAESLGRVRLDVRARPQGGPETFRLQGSAAEVGPASTITLSWALDAPAQPRGASALGEKVVVASLPSVRAAGGGRTLALGPISCARLKNRDASGKSDPFVRVRCVLRAEASAETAAQQNSLSPHWPEPLSLALAADERAVVVEVWDHDAKGSEALGHVELDLRARPSGGPEAFKLQGNAAEVNADSTITLTWAVTSDGGAGGAPAAGGQAKRPNEAAAGTAAGGRPAVQGRHGDGEGAAPPPPPP